MTKEIRITKILLIQPNYRGVYSYAGSKEMTPIFPPMGLAYIAALLRKNGFDVKILEANANNLSYGQVKDIIINYDPSIIGITSTTCMIYEAAKIAKIAKSCSKSKIIVGGIHITSMPEPTLKEFPEIDIAIRGEGEYTLLEIAKGLPLENIKGISYRKNNKIIHNPNREAIDNLDELPYPARDLLPMEKYFSAGTRKRPADYILSSRGCPYSCIFCADHLVHGKKFRMRSAENVVAEIKMLMRDYGIKEFDFIDDNFTMDPNRVEKICSMLINKGINKKLIWRCANGIRIDRVTYPMLKRMKEAGCYMLSLGIESGNEQILKNIRKGINLNQVRQTVKWCNQIGIETRGLFMVGNLGEDEKTMQDTINFAKSINVDTATFHITVPFPMTEYYNMIKKEGKISSERWSDFISYGKVTFEHGKLNPKMLLGMQKKAYREFYLRPTMIIRKIKDLRSPKVIKRYIDAFFALLRMSS